MDKVNHSVLDHILTIPEAQIKIFDLEWQSAFYSVFHQTTFSKMLHTLCMAPIVFSLFVLTSYLDIGGAQIISNFPVYTAVNGAFLVLIIFALWYLVMDTTIGLVSLPILLFFWIAANTFNAAFGAEGWKIALGILFLCSFVQTISHQPEPVPPPHSGSNKFLSYKEWNASAHWTNKLKVSVLFPVFVMVELISSPRLLPIQVLRLMHRMGYKPKLKAITEARAKRVLETGDYNAYYQ